MGITLNLESNIVLVINALAKPVDSWDEIWISINWIPRPRYCFEMFGTEFLQTGLIAINSMTPIGYGQWELIIRDTQTGIWNTTLNW